MLVESIKNKTGLHGDIDVTLNHTLEFTLMPIGHGDRQAAIMALAGLRGRWVELRVVETKYAFDECQLLVNNKPMQVLGYNILRMK